MRTLLFAILLAGAACETPHQEFRPTENVNGRTVEGLREAFYDLATPAQKFGRVKVWSQGANEIGVGGHATCEIKVGMTVDNGGTVPITIDPSAIHLDRVQTGDRTIADVPAAKVSGDTTVPPHASRDVEVAFDLRGVHPTDIRAFRVAWTTIADGQPYTEFTPFVQDNASDYAYVPIYGYYDPWNPYAFYDPYWWPGRVVVVEAPHRVVVRSHR